ncbi:GntR family transcriptional regulator [Streptomyces mirabilis]|uniref:GntR family transcriptional regulator n=1 Tax=Streptomyces mirabilis TaxID=68239 RepID=UPI00380C2136
MPRIERTAPPYVQITDHLRDRILDGRLREGDKLDGVHAVANEWGVSAATAAKAIGQLGVEGLVVTSPRGTFVAALNAKANSPADRIQRARRTGTADAAGEVHRVMAAEVVIAPTYVADLFDMDPGARVVRREWVTLETSKTSGKSHIRSLTVTWHREELADAVPTLLETESSKVGPMLPLIEAHAGPFCRGRDYFHGRGADSREANMLGVPIGAAVLASTWLLWARNDDADADCLVEYGECVIPSRHTVSYPYALDADA